MLFIRLLSQVNALFPSYLKISNQITGHVNATAQLLITTVNKISIRMFNFSRFSPDCAEISV